MAYGTVPATSHEQHGTGGVVAVIPAFNEERFIASVVFQASPYVNHVIVVDDGSSDRTAVLALAAGAEVVQLEHNSGKAAALNAGFQAAQRLDPTAVVCLDADAQHDPAEIPDLVEPIACGKYDVVVGSRFAGKRSKIPGWRVVGQHTLTVVTNTLSGTRVSDSQSGFRAFSGKAVGALRFHSAGLSVESEMQFLFAPAGLRVGEVPITVKYQDGLKRNPVVQALQVLDAVFGLVARRRPLFFIGLPGALIASLGVLLGTVAMIQVQRTGHLMIDSTMLSVLLTLAGLLLVVTGVLLHSIGFFFGRLRSELMTDLGDRVSVSPVPTESR